MLNSPFLFPSHPLAGSPLFFNLHSSCTRAACIYSLTGFFGGGGRFHLITLKASGHIQTGRPITADNELKKPTKKLQQDFFSFTPPSPFDKLHFGVKWNQGLWFFPPLYSHLRISGPLNQLWRCKFPCQMKMWQEEAQYTGIFTNGPSSKKVFLHIHELERHCQILCRIGSSDSMCAHLENYTLVGGHLPNTAALLLNRFALFSTDVSWGTCGISSHCSCRAACCWHPR